MISTPRCTHEVNGRERGKARVPGQGRVENARGRGSREQPGGGARGQTREEEGSTHTRAPGERRQTAKRQSTFKHARTHAHRPTLRTRPRPPPPEHGARVTRACARAHTHTPAHTSRTHKHTCSHFTHCSHLRARTNTHAHTPHTHTCSHLCARAHTHFHTLHTLTHTHMLTPQGDAVVEKTGTQPRHADEGEQKGRVAVLEQLLLPARHSPHHLPVTARCTRA